MQFSSSPSKAYIFDIDGVLTSINTHKIEEELLINFLINLLENNEPVALNTGRPLSWVKKEIVTLINNKITHKNKLNNLIAVCEKGGVILTFSESGEENIFIDKDINISNEIKIAIKNLINTKFLGKVFYDEEKLTMITVEKSENITFSEFNILHPLLNIEIEKILKELDPEGKIKYTPTTLDTDIENNFVGKDFGASKILEWLNQKNHNKNKFITFGDSLSDLAMAGHLFEKGFDVEFVFTGEKEIDIKQYKFKIKITQNKYDKGTVEYIS
jgi:HAD superfamily hydrolase (TIGR01484 family)